MTEPKRLSRFRFYEELNDFLAPRRRWRSFDHEFTGTPSVKDRIESLGVPHTEVDLILVDGDSVGFGHRLNGGERVAVYPVFERFDISDATRLQGRPLRETRFVLDVHLGRLAAYLRLLGFDCRYRNDFADERIIEIARAEGRVILTRDTGLLKDGRVTHGAFLHATEPLEQVREVVERLQLDRQLQPWTRCMKCNGPIESVDCDTLSRETVPAGVLANFDRFGRCAGCGRIYWPGSHFDRLRERLADIDIDLDRIDRLPDGSRTGGTNAVRGNR